MALGKSNVKLDAKKISIKFGDFFNIQQKQKFFVKKFIKN